MIGKWHTYRSVKQEYEEIPSEPSDDVAAVADRKEGIIDGLFVGSRPPGEPVRMRNQDSLYLSSSGNHTIFLQNTSLVEKMPLWLYSNGQDRIKIRKKHCGRVGELANRRI